MSNWDDAYEELYEALYETLCASRSEAPDLEVRCRWQTHAASAGAPCQADGRSRSGHGCRSSAAGDARRCSASSSARPPSACPTCSPSPLAHVAEQTAANVILVNIRLPRVLAALLAGAALAQAGAHHPGGTRQPPGQPQRHRRERGLGFLRAAWRRAPSPTRFGLARRWRPSLGALCDGAGSSSPWRALGARRGSPSCSPAWRSRRSSPPA